MPADNKTKITIIKLRRQKQIKEKTVLVTAYDYPQSLMAERAGVDAILVGDSCGMTTHGYKTTLPVTMDEMINHCEAVSRGSSNAFLSNSNEMYEYGTATLISDRTRVYKGGSWKDRAYWLNPATRRFLDQSQATDDIGFRCAMDRLGPSTSNNPNNQNKGSDYSK